MRTTTFHLRPNDYPTGNFVPVGDTLSPEALAYGLLPAPTNLWPGDLILSCEMAPDVVSKGIMVAQKRCGYPLRHSAFSHAMMFVGPETTVVESTFDLDRNGASRTEKFRTWLRMVGKGEKAVAEIFGHEANPELRAHGVFVGHTFIYSEGKHVLRQRRAKRVKTREDGWNLVANVLQLMGEDYDFEFIRWCGRIAAVKQPAALADWNSERSGSAVVCSTLYAQAHEATFDVLLGERYGVCMPASLSASAELIDIPMHWVRVIGNPALE